MTETSPENQPENQGIIPKVIEEEMKTAYLNYAMSVIVGRALPDVRDGLKPVHRRILYAMSEMVMTHNKPFKKSARVVGTVLGQYHPHGDTAVYDALVRLAQDFSLRYPLIQGQGNFGCFTGDIKVRLADGRSLSFKELIREHLQGKKNFAYTINDEGRIEMGEILHPRLTKRQQRILKILLDNGKEIRCTLDHKFMLRDGTYKEAQYLTPNDSLMPLNFRLSTEKKESEPLIIDYDPIPLAEVYNHKIIQLNFLDKREDVYDLTIAGTHNFALAAGIFVHNSIDGDSPAAMRYTECRLQKMAEDLLDGINEETVDFVDNFDGSLKEPAVLPSKIPNLLVNGSAGIAVGMATSIPPHNLSEVADAIVTMIDPPAIDTAGLLSHIQGPDFPTGGIICGRNGIVNAYSTGRGRIIVRAKYSVEQRKGRPALILTEIPYLVNKAETVAQIADLVRDKKIIGVSDLRDESDREGLRVVIELKQDANPEVVANQLFQHSRMQVTFSFPRHNFLLMQEMLLHQLPEREHPRTIAGKRKQDDAERHLHPGMLEQLVRHNFRIGVLLQLDDDAQSFPVRLIPQIRDSDDLLVPNQIRNLRHGLGLVDKIRNLGEDERRPPFPLLDGIFRPHNDAASAGAVRVHDAVAPADDAPGGEVGPLDVRQQPRGVDGRSVDHRDDRVSHLRQIVRRDDRRHADGDARAAVHEQVRDLRGQNSRFLQAAVEIVDEVNSLLVDAVEQVFGHLLESTFCISHCRWTVSIYRVVHEDSCGECKIMGSCNREVVDIFPFVEEV